MTLGFALATATPPPLSPLSMLAGRPDAEKSSHSSLRKNTPRPPRAKTSQTSRCVPVCVAIQRHGPSSFWLRCSRLGSRRVKLLKVVSWHHPAVALVIGVVPVGVCGLEHGHDGTLYIYIEHECWVRGSPRKNVLTSGKLSSAGVPASKSNRDLIISAIAWFRFKLATADRGEKQKNKRTLIL